MKYTKGLVSVIVPTYKRSSKLKRAINSILNQTYKNIELIVVNDNTPNDLYSEQLYLIIKEINDNRFFFIEQEKHVNGAAARNVGIKYAKGEFISFLDDDDYWELNKLEKQINYLMHQEEDCGGVSTLIKYYQNGKLIRASLPYKDGFIYKEILGRRVEVSTCTILLKRCYLDKTGYFDESLTRHQEIQLLAYFTKNYKIKLLKEYLTCVDITDNENNPNTKQIYFIKNNFFKSVQPLLQNLSIKEIRQIYALHDFETAFFEFKKGSKIKALKQGVRIFSSIKVLIWSLTRTINRIISRVLCRFLVKNNK